MLWVKACIAKLKIPLQAGNELRRDQNSRHRARWLCSNDENGLLHGMTAAYGNEEPELDFTGITGRTVAQVGRAIVTRVGWKRVESAQAHQQCKQRETGSYKCFHLFLLRDGEGPDHDLDLRLNFGCGHRPQAEVLYMMQHDKASFILSLHSR